MHNLFIPNITCGHCSKTVEEALSEAGISAEVDVAKQTVTLKDGSHDNIHRAEEILDKVGFPAKSSRFALPLKSRAILCWFFATPFFIGMISHSLMPPAYWQLILSSVIVTLGLSHFMPGAIMGLKKRSFTMDSLISLGVISSYIVSLYLYLVSGVTDPHNLYFETSSSIITFVLTGAWLESNSLKKASEQLKPAMDSIPKMLKMIKGESHLQSLSEVSVAEIQPGNRFILEAGERLPVDSAAGNALLGDLSALTGESEPVPFAEGEEVPSGAILLNSSARFTAIRSFQHSTYAQIEGQVEKARSYKPQLQRVADKVANYFVPAVLVTAILTLIGTYLTGIGIEAVILRTVAVLVVACPCAVGLAIPTAVSVALGRATKYGAIVKKAQVFELLPKVNLVLWDKTGTLTLPHSLKVALHFPSGEIEADLYNICKTLASLSQHPYSQAIAGELRTYPGVPTLTDAKETPGLGMSAKIGDVEFFLGAPKDRTNEHGVVFSRNGKTMIGFTLTSQLREDSVDTVRKIGNRKIEQMILSGDRQHNVEAIANELDIPWKAELSPKGKHDFVSEQQKSHSVLYVGDGINDGPALASASVSAAFSVGSALAQQQADVVLLSSNLSAVNNLIGLSRTVLRIMHQNLFWAFIYNILMIPLAITGVLSPTIAALSMALSDVIVIGNSLRLRWIRID